MIFRSKNLLTFPGNYDEDALEKKEETELIVLLLDFTIVEKRNLSTKRLNEIM